MYITYISLLLDDLACMLVSGELYSTGERHLLSGELIGDTNAEDDAQTQDTANQLPLQRKTLQLRCGILQGENRAIFCGVPGSSLFK